MDAVAREEEKLVEQTQRLNIDAEVPGPLWSPEIAARSKAEVWKEDWKADNWEEASKKRMDRHGAPAPNAQTWTTLKPHAVSKPHVYTLYYQAPSSPPIPSRKERDDAEAKNHLGTNINLHAICRLGDAVIKWSASPNVVEEAENLLFLAENRPELRISTVLAVWSTVQHGVEVFHLMLNFIEGIQLTHERFAELSIHAQDTICAKVSSQLRYLRELPSKGYYGRPHGQGWLCPPPALDTNASASNVVVGPHKTYEEFCSAVCRARQILDAISNPRPEWHPIEPEIFAELASRLSAWEPHEPTFTWVDPKISNIIAQPVKRDDRGEDWEVFLIDWEYCGWYPAWVQGMQFRERCGIWVRDSKDPTKFDAYRKNEILPRMLEDFDPESDLEILAWLQDIDWEFF